MPETTVALELRRIAVELREFPFVPRRLTEVRRARRGIRVPQGRLQRVEHGRHGCLVYYDILSHGGTGTRREVLDAVEGVLTPLGTYWWLEPPVPEEPTQAAAYQVASARIHAPATVSPPELPLQVGYGWKPTPDASEAVDWVGVSGAQLALELGCRTGAWAVELLAREEEYVGRARQIWRAALQATRDDYGAWLAEQEKLEQLFSALRSTMTLRRVSSALATTRMICLDE